MGTKKIILTIVLMISATGIYAQSSMFSKLSSNKSVTTVYVSKAMLGMIPNMDMGGAIDTKEIANKLEQIEIYTSEDKSAIELMRSEAKTLLQNKTYEVLMSVKEDDENVTFFAQKDKDKFKDFIMLVDEPNECVIIRMIGSFTSEDIQQVINKSNKKEKE